MIALTVIVRHELAEHLTQMTLTQRDYLAQALVSNRPHEAFC